MLVVNVIRGRTRGTPGETIWIWVEKICAVSAGVDGLAQVMTTDGKIYYLTDKAEEVIETIRKMTVIA